MQRGNNEIAQSDDNIQWFSDEIMRILSYCETPAISNFFRTLLFLQLF